MKLPQIEISIKFKGALKSELRQINDSNDTAAVCRLLFDTNTIDWTEEFIMLMLNINNKVIGYYRVSKGGFTATVVDVKVIAITALSCLATKVIIAHNHPSGSLAPSSSDINMTRRVFDALALLDIKLIEHIIITSEGYYSFADNGNMPY